MTTDSVFGVFLYRRRSDDEVLCYDLDKDGTVPAVYPTEAEAEGMADKFRDGFNGEIYKVIKLR